MGNGGGGGVEGVGSGAETMTLIYKIRKCIS